MGVETTTLRVQPRCHTPPRSTSQLSFSPRLLKVAGRVIESATRIRIALASCCPEAETFSLIALKLQPSGP